ncbi:MAG: hypothetical protein IT368_12850 [Candidatus Hydrogenedentes bacterium]|nr:hypothetical protein [Candidatus Hydrogenedentota bacterium]
MNRHNRRTFLRRAGAVTAGAGLSIYTGKSSAQDSPTDLTVTIDAPESPLLSRGFAILQDRIQQRCPVRVTRVQGGGQIVLGVDTQLAHDAFRIDDDGEAIQIEAGSPRGLLYGIGKFLRTSHYRDGFSPSSWRCTSGPRGALRGMYFASHFHNWYHQAPEAEFSRYLEDLALWGVNAVMVIFPMINLQDWDDPEAQPALDRVCRYAKIARELGIEFATGLNNCLFIGAPKEIRAARLPDPLGRRGNHGHPICPSNPEGHKYILENSARLFEGLSGAGLDILVLWPYDEGGCACAQCAPWGSNGYLKLSRDQAALGRKYFPEMKTVLSTWMFDTPPEGEWEGLTAALAKDGAWVDYILADAHEDFPRYPLDVCVPGNLPLINFPEISMWGNSPWGGFGANPLPSRFQRLWDQVSPVVEGGFPYSEGIYEDMNKAVVLQFYWDRDRSARSTLEEYIAYEYGDGVTEDVLALVELLETAASRNYQKQPVDADGVRRAFQLAESVQARLPGWAHSNWRWEILYLRALLDMERFAGGALDAPAAEAAMLRLIEIYHCQLETDDPYHHRVRPPLKRAISRFGEH